MKAIRLSVAILLGVSVLYFTGYWLLIEKQMLWSSVSVQAGYPQTNSRLQEAVVMAYWPLLSISNSSRNQTLRKRFVGRWTSNTPEDYLYLQQNEEVELKYGTYQFKGKVKFVEGGGSCAFESVSTTDGSSFDFGLYYIGESPDEDTMLVSLRPAPDPAPHSDPFPFKQATFRRASASSSTPE